MWHLVWQPGAAAPMVIPTLAQIGMFKFLLNNVSLPIANSVLGHAEGMAAAASVALIQGKQAFLAVETFGSGRNSLLVRGMKGVLENPFLAGIVGGSAFGVGYLIAFHSHIPWLSSSIADESEGQLSLSS